MTAPGKKTCTSASRNLGAGTAAAPAPLPTVSTHDPLEGVASLTSGRGVQLQPPSPSALLSALALFEDDKEDSSGSGAPEPLPPLPTGATWPLLSIVTSEGLQVTAVQPSLETTVDSRDPRRLTMTKRRAVEQ